MQVLQSWQISSASLWQLPNKKKLFCPGKTRRCDASDNCDWMVGCDWSGGRWRLGACKINFCAVGCYVVGSAAGGRDGRWKGSSLGLAERLGIS